VRRRGIDVLTVVFLAFWVLAALLIWFLIRRALH
jgi:hypothetical protein